MENPDQEPQEGVHYEEGDAQGQEIMPEAEEDYQAAEATPQKEHRRLGLRGNSGGDRSGFVHGLSVGLGIGCIATFIIMWITVFFTPQLPSTITYETMLAVFIYPLIYLLAVGLVALTAGIVREYYSAKRKP